LKKEAGRVDRRDYRLLNVFAVPGDRLSGNPLCVFENGDGLSVEQMQALARQLNLSETTFLLPPTGQKATARVRIFTPTFEMPFAGHPTLGTAHVVRALRGGEQVSLEMKVGVVEVQATANFWTLRAARAPVTREPKASAAALAEMLGLPEQAVERPLWVDTGAEQLVVPLRSADDVRRARPKAEALARLGHSDARGESMAYVWGREQGGDIAVRFFFLQNGALVEDPATGSACANLGGYLLATSHPLPVRWRIRQGVEIQRPSELRLTVEDGGAILVGGEVVELGRGTLEL
jgi:trans-2,3-dihydro-3-hydroxyanthranilate isomerase